MSAVPRICVDVAAMSLETDSPGRSEAFAPESVHTGAVISLSGEKLIVSGEAVVRAIDARLTTPGLTLERNNQWLVDNVPLLSRGEAWIVPLSWEPPQPDRNVVERQRLSDRANELWIDIRSSCSYRQGNQITIDLSAEPGQRGRYASELVRTGVRRANWWEFGQCAVVLVVHGESLPAPKSMIAVHVVPISWVSTRRPAKKIPRLDLGWSWAEVVEFARRDASAATDTASSGR